MTPQLLLAVWTATSTPALDLIPPLQEPQLAEEEGASPLTVSLVSAGAAAVILGGGVIAWWDKGFTELHFRDTGFLGEDAYAGGADKMGHLTTSYFGVAIMTAAYEALGVSPTTAMWGASILTFAVFNGFEFIDGFTDYGVEYSDIIMNTAGVSLGLLSELYPTFNSVFGLRLGYVPSHDFLSREKTLLKFINDYNGMLFYVDFKLKGILEVLDQEPGWLRYGMFGLVWGTNNYSPIRNKGYEERMLGLHVGISLPEVLRVFGDGDEGVEGIATFFDYYAVPFLSIILMNELNDGRWILSFGVSNRASIDL